jgi:thiamine-monophosphate kinase
MREEEWIAKLLRPLARSKEALGLHDDAAIMRVPAGHELVVTTDMLQAGVHFLTDGDPADIAWKALAVNLSDLAAMGAVPHAYQLAIALSSAQNEAWLTRFVAGLEEAGAQHGIALTGGDTIRTRGSLTLSITAHGLVPEGMALLRSGARLGDAIYVSGMLGDAALSLAIADGRWQNVPDALASTALARYWRPTPRLTLGVALRGIATSCMDISDGLLTDCQKLCAASKVGARLGYGALPLSEVGIYAQKYHRIVFDACISAGDDYELLCTIPTDVDVAHLPLTRIGTITQEHGVKLYDGDTLIKLPNSGYEH